MTNHKIPLSKLTDVDNPFYSGNLSAGEWSYDGTHTSLSSRARTSYYSIPNGALIHFKLTGYSWKVNTYTESSGTLTGVTESDWYKCEDVSDYYADGGTNVVVALSFLKTAGGTISSGDRSELKTAITYYNLIGNLVNEETLQNNRLSKLETVTQNTQNIYFNEDVTIPNVGYVAVNLDYPLPPGTYTISADVTSDDTDANNNRITFYDDSSNVLVTYITRGNRQNETFTLTFTANHINFYSSDTAAHSGADDYASFHDIQIESGSSASLYTKPFTAIDYIARSMGDGQENATVLEVGTGKAYTSLRTALEACVNPSSSNRYIVKFYGDGTEYDVSNDITSAEISGGTYSGLHVPAYTTLVGVNGRDKSIIVLRFASKNSVISTLNVDASASLNGITVIGEKTRYAIHDDFYVNYNTERTVEDCVFEGIDCEHAASWGAGYRSGQISHFKNCIFKHTVSSSTPRVPSAVAIHNNVDSTIPSQWTFENCRFVEEDSGNDYGVILRTMTRYNGTSRYTDRIDDFYFYGNKITAMLVTEVDGDPSKYGQGLLTRVSGYGNDLVTADVTVSHSDSVDYSWIVDMI